MSSGQIVVIKIGTSSIIDPQTNFLAVSNLARMVETISVLKKKGFRVVVVSSGSIGLGLIRLGMRSMPKQKITLAKKQVERAPFLSLFIDS